MAECNICKDRETKQFTGTMYPRYEYTQIGKDHVKIVLWHGVEHTAFVIPIEYAVELGKSLSFLKRGL